MFGLDAVPAVTYSDPWNLKFAERLRQLAVGRRRVAYFYERADNSTFRYRIYNMVQVLNSRADEVSAAYFFLDDLAQQEQIAGIGADDSCFARAHREEREYADRRARAERQLLGAAPTRPVAGEQSTQLIGAVCR